MTHMLLPDGKPEGFVSQETHYVSATKPSRLMLFRETLAVYCENRMEHTDTLCVCGWGECRVFNVKAGGTYSYHCSLKTENLCVTR
jgi:hypothetical protein